ncbi:MAG: archaeosortase/exosortase family protein [Marinoscillum sp.]
MRLFGKKLSAGQLFIIRALGLIVVWKVAYSMVIAPYTTINPWLTNAVGSSTAAFFDWFGMNSQFQNGFLYINNLQSVFIGHPCNGLELHALFIGFLLISPGTVLKKVLYTCVGVMLIFLANIVRVYLLGFNYVNNPSTFEFNHKYTYLGLVYLLIFILWIVWIEVVNKRRIVEA